MRPSRDLLIAVALASGGWLCEGQHDDPCPGALTCPLDVADVCCPFEAPQWCDGRCIVASDPCEKPSYSCLDATTLGACDVTATIESATCTQDDASASTWTVAITGTLSGCGQEEVFALFDGANPADSYACGTWDEGVFGGCVPGTDATTATTFEIHKSDDLSPGQSHQHRVVLEMAMVTCGP
jgi:hypothetical protein